MRSTVFAVALALLAVHACVAAPVGRIAAINATSPVDLLPSQPTPAQCRRARAALEDQAAALRRRAAILRRVCSNSIAVQDNTTVVDQDASVGLAGVDGVDGRRINCRRAKAALEQAAAQLRRRFAALARVCRPGDDVEDLGLDLDEDDEVSLASAEDATELEGVDGCDGKRVRCRRARAALEDQAAALRRRAAILRRVCSNPSIEEESLETDEDAQTMAEVDGVDGRRINCRRAKAALEQAAAQLRRRFAALARVCRA